MYCGQHKERQEVLEIAFTDAGAHPWAVMVLSLYTDATRTAMESSGRPHDLTG